MPEEYDNQQLDKTTPSQQKYGKNTEPDLTSEQISYETLKYPQNESLSTSRKFYRT